MLSCKYCDYYEEMKRTADHGKEVSVCHFTEHLFMKDVETLEMDYPCKEMSYQDYLESIEVITARATA